MNRVYLMPMITADLTMPSGRVEVGARVPKHRAAILAVPGASFRAMDYGAEPVFLVYATDIDQATHDTIAADATCAVFPADLTNTIGANLATVQSKLDVFNIPNQWITSGMTYRQLLRAIIILFQFAQRLHGMGAARLFTGGVTLATPFNQLPAAMRTALQSMALSFNMNTTGMSGTTTLRIILKNLHDQWPAGNVLLGEAF